MNIIIDDRERSVIPFFDSIKNNKNNITYKVSRINYGDYSVNYNNNIIFIIERKTWKDLSQSIRDGRKDNIAKLIELRDKIENPLSLTSHILFYRLFKTEKTLN